MKQWGCILTKVLAPLHDAMKREHGAWLGMVGVDRGGLLSMAG